MIMDLYRPVEATTVIQPVWWTKDLRAKTSTPRKYRENETYMYLKTYENISPHKTTVRHTSIWRLLSVSDWFDFFLLSEAHEASYDCWHYWHGTVLVHF